MRTRTWALVAFVVGAILGGVLLLDGGPALLTSTDARVVLRIENVGTHDVATSLNVQAERDGTTLYSNTLTVAAGAVRETILRGTLSGEYLATAEFEWAEAGRRGSGDYIQAFQARQCGADATIVVTFVVDSTNGISFPQGDDVSCR